MEGAELRQIRIVCQDNEPTVEQSQADDTVHDIQNARDVGFIPGPCQHNRKFACVFVPCAIPLFYIGGESLFGTAVFCVFIVYLVDHTSKTKQSSLVAYVLSVLIFQLTAIYCLVPFLW